MTTRPNPEPELDQIPLLRSHLKRNPDDGHAWLALARILSRLAPSAELHHALEQAIKSQPESDETWLLAGRAKQRENGLPAAIGWLEHCARENPGLGAPRRAATALRSAAEREAAWKRADELRQSGQWQEALQLYREVEALQPGDVRLLNNIGTCLASLEDFEAAAGCFESALEIRPDFAEAKLNMGLLHATQGRRDTALRIIGAAVRDASLDRATRRSVGTLRDILREHERLAPFLDQACRTGDMTRFQRALGKTPPALSRPHDATITTLETLVERFRNLRIDPDAFRHPGDLAKLPFVEACAQCNLDGADPDVIELCEPLTAASAGPGLTAGHSGLTNMLDIIGDRAAMDAAILHGPEGEAWLRYWHARLLRDATHGMPGQYKVAANAIAGLPLTPPENVAGTFRVLLSRLLPSLTPGPGRAIFMYIAINMIHGFGDGNGRLSRFMLGWEMEAAGLPPIAVPPGLRARTARAMDTAWLHCDIRPIVDVFRAAHAETGRLLALLHP